MIRASALFSLPLDPAFVAALGSLDPDEVRVRLVPKSFRFLWPRWVAAMTMPWAIYVRGDLLAASPEVLGRTIAHEMVHVRQWKQLGPVRFLYRYLGSYLGNRLAGMNHVDAYRSIPLELEAYRLARTAFG